MDESQMRQELIQKGSQFFSIVAVFGHQGWVSGMRRHKLGNVRRHSIGQHLLGGRLGIIRHLNATGGIVHAQFAGGVDPVLLRVGGALGILALEGLKRLDVVCGKFGTVDKVVSYHHAKALVELINAGWEGTASTGPGAGW